MAISPATQPSRAAPRAMMTGKRSISFRIRVLPKMISGMLMTRPKTSRGTLPLAAAATPTTLSRLMTRSATTMVLMAAARPAWPSRSLPRVVAFQQAHADPQQQRRADQLEIRQGQQVDGEEGQDHAQHDGADAAEQDGLLLLGGGSEREAIAMTTALSPLRTMLIRMIWDRAIQNSGLERKRHVFPRWSSEPRMVSLHPRKVGTACRLSAGALTGGCPQAVSQAYRARPAPIRLAHGEEHAEGVAHAVGVFLQRDPRAVQRGDLADDGQAQTAAVLLRAEQAMEALEDARRAPQRECGARRR